MNVLWVGTSHLPSPGGGAVYIDLLAKGFDSSERVGNVTILCEKHPDQPGEYRYPNGKVHIRRMFPYRGSADIKDYTSYLKYLLQNLQLLNIPKIVKETGSDLVVFHSWYLLHPSLIQLVLKMLKSMNCSLLIDVRDVALPAKKFKRLSLFDGCIACSARVVNHLKSSTLSNNMFHIPVPLEAASTVETNKINIMQKYALKEDGYIFAPVGVSERKRFPLLYDAWRLVLQQGYEVDLVVSGRTRSWRKRYEAKPVGGRLITTKAIDRSSVHSLYQGAALSINPSDKDSFGRVPVEAIVYGKPLIFASGVGEFSAFHPDEVCDTNDPSELCRKIISCIEYGKLRSKYDLGKHDIDEVLEATLDALQRTRNKTM